MGLAQTASECATLCADNLAFYYGRSGSDGCTDGGKCYCNCVVTSDGKCEHAQSPNMDFYQMVKGKNIFT